MKCGIRNAEFGNKSFKKAYSEFRIPKSAFLFLVFLLGAAWQPGALQKAIVDHVLEKIKQTTPYQIRVDSVSGDFISSISLNGVHVTAKGETRELLQASVLEISIQWTGLIHHKLEIRRLKLIAPTVHATLAADHTLLWPKESPSPKEDSSFGFYIERIEVTQGRLVFQNQAVEPERSLTLAPLELAASLTPDSVAIQKLSLALGSGSLSASGRWGLKNAQDVSFDIQTHEFPVQSILRAILAPPEALHLVHSGQWSVRGAGREWTLRSQGTLDGAPLTADIQARQRGRYQAHVRLHPLPLREAWHDPKSGRLGTLSASFEAAAPQWNSKTPDVSGTWRIVQPSSGVLRAPEAQARVALLNGRGSMALNFSAAGLQAGATLELNLAADRIKGPFQLDLKNFQGLAEWIPSLKEAQGTVAANGSLDGSLADLSIHAHAQAKQLRCQTKTIAEAILRIDGSLGSGHELTVEGSVGKIALRAPDETPWDMTACAFHMQGKNPAWQAKTQVAFRNKLTFNYAGDIQKQTGGWRFAWGSLILTPATGAALRATQPGEASVSREGTWTLKNLQLSNGQGSLRMPLSVFQKGVADVQFSVTDVPLASFAPFVELSQKYDGLLNADVRLHGPWRAPEGILNVHISTGSIAHWKYDAFDLAARFAPPWIYIDRLDVLMPHKENNIQGKGRLPLHLVNAQEPDQDMAFHMEAPHVDLAMLTAAVPGLAFDKGGNASLSLDVTGRYAKPDVTGQLNAHFPHLTLAQAGLDIHDFSADIRSQGKSLEIKDLSGKTKKGEFHGAGQSALPALNFTLKGTNVQLHIPKQLDARFDLDLLLGGDLSAPDLSGDVSPQDVTYFQVTKKKEKEVKDNESAPPSRLWEALSLNVHSAWPHSVWYRDGLSKIETSGDIRLEKKTGEDAPYMSGRISIVRGTYDVYGRDFILNSGDLIFTGPPDINPVLNIHATYTGGGTLVNLNVTGTAKKPQPALTSDPPLAENDIISVLIFGHPLNQINAGAATEQSQTQQAQAAAGSVLGGYLTQNLRDRGMNLGLDVVRVDSTNTGGNRLTVGRYIGEKLFVSYGQPLQNNAARVFDANYYLGNYWSAVGETGASTDSFLDLLFRYPLNRPPSSPATGFVPNSATLLAPVQALPFPTANPVPAH